MDRTTGKILSRPGFAVDHGSIDKNSGRIIDFAAVSSNFLNASTNKKEIEAGRAVSERGDGSIVPRTDTEQSGLALSDDGAGTVTATQADHGYKTGDMVTIEGAAEARFNGTFSVTRVDADTFTYSIPDGDSTAGNATGTVTSYIKAVGFLVATSTQDADQDAKSGVGVVIGGVVYENLLPDAQDNGGSLPQGIKDDLAATSKGFVYETYEDTRTS